MNRRERRAKKQRNSGAKVVGARPRPVPIGASGALAPADPDSLQLHAIQAAQADDPGRAVELFRRALALNPHLPEVHFNLALAYTALGRRDEAISHYRKAIELKPGFAEAHNNLGLILREQGKLEEALKSFARATALRPDYFGAHNNLGLALKGLHRLDAAIASYRRAIAIRSDFADAHNNLGVALVEQDRLDEAIASYRRALKIRPRFAEAENNLGGALTKLGENDAAIIHYRKALALKPGDAEAHRNLGVALGGQGKLDQAAAQFEKAIALDPEFVKAYQSLATYKTFTARDDHLERMKELLRRATLSDEERTELGFAIAKALEDCGEYDEAFDHLERANRLKRTSISPDVTWGETLADGVVSVFDADLMARKRGGGSESTLPIFVIGMPRSGTTLVEQIIASHGDVAGGGELRDMREVIGEAVRESGEDFPGIARSFDAADFARLGDAYVARLQRRAPDARRITDKMLYNFFHVGLIHLALPQAKIVHCVRDPVDTCVSCFAKLFAGGVEFSYDLAELGRYYRLYRRLMDHWRALLPERILDLRYEDMVSDQEKQTRRLLAHLELPWDAACLTFHETDRVVRTASSAQVRRPIYSGSVGRAARYRAHLGPLIEALGPLAGTEGAQG
ncbi:MAG: tetratricopeptide repeat protein [Alphaproteobacteria bacterium]